MHKYQLFVSYTRTPDGPLAREIERFLEAFHETPMPVETETPLPQLQICVDGSDFSLPPVDEGASEAAGRDVLEVVYEYLAKSRELLVLCSGGAAHSPWVDKEVRWFLDNAGPARVRIAFTDGAEPWEEPESFFPRSVIEHGLHNGIAYDLRGYDARRSRSWRQVPEFRRELVRLAADLCGRSAGDLYPTWLEAELERTRRQSLAMASTARFETLAGDPSRGLLRAYEAHELHPSDTTEMALREAYKVAVLHHHNRREVARITGSGPSYLASRWKQGDVFMKTSADGRYRLLVTERGKDGPNPPGDVFLVSNETLRATRLEPPERYRRRVEDAAFDRGGRHIFVTRQFDLGVYSTEGRYVGGYAFSRHTKSPVHLVDGYFAGRYILGAETKGGVWLVDPTDPKATLTVLGEAHGDATIFCDISPNGALAALIFESGRAALLSLDEEGKPRLADIAGKDILFAGFVGRRDDALITSSDDGSIVMWEIANNTAREEARVKPLPSAADWVSLDETGTRIAAVGVDQKLYVIDRDSGELLETLDHADDIDWAAVRSVAIPEREVNPGSAIEFGEVVPFPSETLNVANVQQADGATWLFTEDQGESEYLTERATYRLEGAEARQFAYGAALVEEHGDILWFRYAPGSGGKAYWRLKEFLRPFPSDELEVNCAFEKDGTVWVGTRAGAYRHRGGEHRLVTPQDMMIERIEEVAGRIWVHGKEGACVLEEDRFVRISEPFLQIREIKEVAGEVWILTKTGVMFDSDGPAHRVHGYFASPVPSAAAKVSDVLEAGGFAWAAEADSLHRFGADSLRTIAGISPNVDGMAQVGGTLWLTTHERGLMASRGNTYRMGAEALVPQRLEMQGVLHRRGARSWLQYHSGDGRPVVAETMDDGLRELSLEGATLQNIVEQGREPWFLTTRGVYREAADSTELIDLPDLSYHARVELPDETWLLASNAAVRIEPGMPTVFRTGVYKPYTMTQAAGRTWILTINDETFDAGPAYRVARKRATPFVPDQGGVVRVAEIDGATWLLTAESSRAGPMMRA